VPIAYKFRNEDDTQHRYSCDNKIWLYSGDKWMSYIQKWISCHVPCVIVVQIRASMKMEDESRVDFFRDETWRSMDLLGARMYLYMYYLIGIDRKNCDDVKSNLKLNGAKWHWSIFAMYYWPLLKPIFP